MSKIISAAGLATAAYFTGGAALAGAGGATALTTAGAASSFGAMTGASAAGWGAASGGLLSSLGTAATLASLSSTLFGGIQQAGAIRENAKFQSQQLELDAQNEMLAARMEETKGKEASNSILDNLNQVTAQQQLYYATGGVDPGFGTPASVDRATRNLAETQMSTTRANAQTLALSRRRSASSMRMDRLNINSQAGSQVTSAYTGTAAQAGSMLADLYERRRQRG